MRNPNSHPMQNPLWIMMLSFLTLGLSMLPSSIAAPGSDKATPPEAPKTSVSKPLGLQLEKKAFPQGTLYSLKVPAKSSFKVIPALSKTLASVDSQLWKIPGTSTKPLFLINGGFFDPNNSLTTSFVFEDGVLTGDPRINPQLVNNPKLVPYLPKIFNRTEFRVYLCQKNGGQFQTQYDIVPHNAPIPTKCLTQQSLGAGPLMLPTLEDKNEAFVDYNAAGKLTRDPIGVCSRNARSAVGLTAAGDVILMMGAQSPAKPNNSGFTLADIAGLMKARGAVKAMSLDGGSSSSLVFNGKTIFGKVNKDGNYVKRPVKSVLMTVPR